MWDLFLLQLTRTRSVQCFITHSTWPSVWPSTSRSAWPCHLTRWPCRPSNWCSRSPTTHACPFKSPTLTTSSNFSSRICKCWKYNVVLLYHSQFLPKSLQFTPHSSPMKVSFDFVLIQWLLGAVSIRKTVLPGMAIPMLKIRRPNGRLILNMEIAIRR